MFNAELVGTSSKVEEVTIGELREWVNLCCSSAKVNYEKVSGMGEGTAIKYNVSPYVLKITKPKTEVEEIPAEIPTGDENPDTDKE